MTEPSAKWPGGSSSDSARTSKSFESMSTAHASEAMRASDRTLIDLLVELREVTRTAKRQILDRAWELSIENGYAISVVIVSQEAFEQGPLSFFLGIRPEYPPGRHRDRRMRDYIPVVEINPDELTQLLEDARSMVNAFPLTSGRKPDQ